MRGGGLAIDESRKYEVRRFCSAKRGSTSAAIELATCDVHAQTVQRGSRMTNDEFGTNSPRDRVNPTPKEV